MLAAAQYRSDGNGGHAAWCLQVLEAEDGVITAIHCYLVPALFGLFGFPPTL
jgi:RNA polymerase sigma-70 factor, ECF subfamily